MVPEGFKRRYNYEKKDWDLIPESECREDKPPKPKWKPSDWKPNPFYGTCDPWKFTRDTFPDRGKPATDQSYKSWCIERPPFLWQEDRSKDPLYNSADLWPRKGVAYMLTREHFELLHTLHVEKCDWAARNPDKHHWDWPGYSDAYARLEKAGYVYAYKFPAHDKYPGGRLTNGGFACEAAEWFYRECHRVPCSTFTGYRCSWCPIRCKHRRCLSVWRTDVRDETRDKYVSAMEKIRDYPFVRMGVPEYQIYG